MLRNNPSGFTLIEVLIASALLVAMAIGAGQLMTIGVVAGRANLYICAGHGPWGISTGPGSARLVSDLMLGRQPAIPSELAPDRFGQLPH